MFRFQLLPHVVEHAARRSILFALLRLSAASGLYPQCLRLDGVECDSTSVTSGQFGEVRTGRYQARQICIKIFILDQTSEVEALVGSFTREALIWNQLKHPNVLQFSGIYHLSDVYGRIGLVSPWMENGNLTEYLKAHPDVPRLPFVYDIVSGLQYLHQNQVIHGDLKGLNILISDAGFACLADFGLSAVMDADVIRWASLKTGAQVGGTARWMAPEIIDGAEIGLLRPSSASDVYSLASVMIEVFTGEVPYHEIPQSVTVIAKIIRGIKPAKPKREKALELTEGIWKIMQKCWSDTPSDRPTVDQVLELLRKDAPLGVRVEPKHVLESADDRGDDPLSESDLTFLMTAVSEVAGWPPRS
ncbi:kinase-like protein [Macrolepiota fuliginosa MF-IS2]|uniref:Kinase-like protein n=1 Tax=Macrolepiota fuliginosa MF-IS2 TaxID=1400762 RepID=A0A9P6C3U4_9AGAR|nr:kinase-like protein [Macrolepiota fuliginosa MF-IS2]